MAIASLGTPVNTHSATGSVTGTWGTGQLRTAGDLLVAVISAAASTSVAATGGTAGWTKQKEQFSNTSSGPVLVACWTKPAAGADAAPVFTSTETGTAGGMDCMLLELQGAAGATPVDAQGAYASGATAGTLSSMTCTTSSSATASGEYAISVFAQEAAAGNLTFTDAGTGTFTKLLNGNGVSSVLQTYVGARSAPVAAATLNDAGAFSTATSAFGAGFVIIFAVAVPPGTLVPLEAFANNSAATVTSGGLDAPASGTSETLTVNVTTAFPVANAYRQFHFVDQLLPTEKMLATAAPGGTGSGQSWTVTRGAEGTTPVTHSAGYTVVPVVTAGVLALADEVSWINVAAQYGADPTGAADSTSAIQLAITALAAAGSGGVLYFPAGSYKISTTLTLNSATPVYFQGDGLWVTFFKYTGTGACLRVYNSGAYEAFGQAGGGITGITIDGTSATAPAYGLHMGDILQYTTDVGVQNFTGSGSRGCWFDNQFYWTEQLGGRIYAANCTAHVVFDNAPGGAATSSGSFMRSDLSIWINQYNPTYDGVVFQNGAFDADGSLVLRGNFGTNNSTLTSAVLRLTGSTPAGITIVTNSGLRTCHLDIGVECDLNPTGGYTFAPSTIQFGSGVNAIASCYGILSFGASYAFTPSNNSGNVSMVGIISGDTTLLSGLAFPSPVGMGAGYYVGSYASAATLANGSTINTSLQGYVPVTCTAAVTGVIMMPFAYDGQVQTVVNTGSFPVTFAAAATSFVATGASEVIPAGQTRQYVFNYAANRWYPAPQGPWRAFLPSTFTSTSSTSAQSVTGLASVLPTGTYALRGYLPYEGVAASGTATLGFTFSGTAGAATVVSWKSNLVATPFTAAPVTTSTSPYTSQTSATLATTLGAFYEASGTVFATAAGTLQLQVTCTVASNFKMMAGAWLEFQQIG
jgi:hypothetical protein